MCTRKKRARGLFWLEKFAEEHGIDKQEIDDTLEYYENKGHLEDFRPKTLTDLVDEYASDTVEPGVEEVVVKLVEKCKNVIVRERAIRVHVRAKERQSLKREKFELGKLILQEREYLHIRYGDNYFGKLAKRINEHGYSADQLRKCARFAGHPDGRKWRDDPNESWEKIRTERLRKKKIEPIFSANECLVVQGGGLRDIEIYVNDTCSFCKDRDEERYSSCEVRKLLSRLLEAIRKKVRESEYGRQASLLQFMTGEPIAFEMTEA